MLSIKMIREDAQRVERLAKTKDPEADVINVVQLDEKLRETKTKVETLKSERNRLSKAIGALKRDGKDCSAIMEQVQGLGSQIQELDTNCRQLDETFTYELSKLPNLPMSDIKDSLDPAQNVCIKTFGEKPSFSFPFKNHMELNEKLHLFDFQRGAKISGTGWPVYRDLGARLEWALINYMLDAHVKKGFMQWMTPLLVRPEMMYGAGQLPKFGKQVFRLEDEQFDLFMIPTAEVPLNGMHYEEIFPQDELPKKYVAYSPCFRREAGAAGSQERGLIRTHQFNKVEMYCFTTQEQSVPVFEEMLTNAGNILEGLGMHYRNMLLVTGDMSFSAARTVDVEVWLPGQNRYYEVSSVSNCTDFQARRSKIRYRTKDGNLEFAHTLNGSGLATSRLMVALLENNQRKDGSVVIPEPLRKYLGNLEIIEPKE